MSSVLEARAITKEFPGVRALDGVDFSVEKGEIHSLCGENGAGKSTLMKILAGVYPVGSYSGEIKLNGQVVGFHSTADSRKARIAVVHQELSLIPEMTVAENIFLGNEPRLFGVVRKSELLKRTQEMLDLVGLNFDPKVKVANLGIGEKQMIEIAKAMSQNPQILILDEPTSALTETEVEHCLNLMMKLRAKGISLILITHKLKEVFKVSDRITVFRDGKLVKSVDAKSCDEDQLISLMVGRQIQNLYPQSTDRKLGKTVLSVKNLSAPHPRFPHKKLLDDVSFSVKSGEILGIAGLMGSGRTETLMGIFGALSTPVTGTIEIDGTTVTINSPKDAHAHGLGLASEDRKRFGLILDDPIFKNISLPSLSKFSKLGIVGKFRERQASQEMATRFKVKAPDVGFTTKNLSGGNQQKVVLSKCVLKGPKVLFLDEPTRGIDVGARSEIYDWIVKLASEGLAIVVVSSEMQEVLGLSDRVIVMCEGRLTDQFSKVEASEEKIMSAATRFKEAQGALA